MATLVKEDHGLIYEEYFHESPRYWALTPSNVDCLRFEEDGLHILHNSKYVSYTLKEPEEPYCLLMKLTHKPIDEEDIAGLLVFSDTNNYAECQTYLASAPSTIGNNGENVSASYDLSGKYVRYSFDDDDEGESDDTDSPSSADTVVNPTNGFIDLVYKYIRMIKYNNKIGHTYQFFASVDGQTWIEVGNTDYDQNNSIGFFLYATKNANTLIHGNCIIHAFYIYKQSDIVIDGISDLYSFEIIDRANPHDPLERRVIVRSDDPGEVVITQAGNRAIINTNKLNLPLTNAIVRIYPRGDKIHNYPNTIAEYELPNKTFGGDKFKITYDIKLIIDNEEVEPGTTFDLGTLFTKSFKKNIVVYNNENFDLTNLSVSIVAFSEYYCGEDVVELSIYNGNNEGDNQYLYNWSQEVMLGMIPAHQGIELIMKLSDVPKRAFYAANPYRFKLVIK